MMKLSHILFGLAVVFSLTGCRGKEDKEAKMEARVQANKEEIISILRSTGRPGMESVISHLQETDYFTRGGGGHHTEPGGLAQHSLETYRLMRLISWFQSSDSVIIVSIFHDMGKIDEDGWHPWRSVKHLGEWGLKLSEAEYFSIFKHHRPELKYWKYGLRRSLAVADMLSTGWWKLWHKSPEAPMPPES